MATRPALTWSDDVLTVAIPGSTPMSFHAIWVRDACSCATCRRPTTNERLHDSTTIPLDLGLVSAKVDDSRLLVQTSDGHTSTIDVAWLVQHATRCTSNGNPAGDLTLWTRDNATIAEFDRHDLSTDAGLHRWLDALLSTGAAVLHGVQPDDDGLREIAALVAEIRATNYGVTWAIEADLQPVSAVDSNRPLLVHTDLPYRDVAPGIQFLLASVVDVDGGMSTLVDGYAVAEQLRRSDPDAWQRLTTTEFSYPFVREGVEYIGRAPLIGRHLDGRYHQIRRAPDLVGVPYLSDPSDAPELYAAVRAWTAAVDDPANEISIALAPGDLLAFDNHRLLHGRTGFELGTHGRRRLVGCYLDVEDVRSRHAVAARAM